MAPTCDAECAFFLLMAQGLVWSVQTGLEHVVQPTLISDSELVCLSFLSTGIIGVHHHAQLNVWFLSFLIKNIIYTK